MSKTDIPEKVKIRLWGKAGGRCQYEGCNDRLWLDELTKAEFNVAYIAHIIADSPAGPRGEVILSERLKTDISNLMLMCDKHHRLIDKENVEGHPVYRLQEMKREHEKRIDIQTSIQCNKKSHMILFGANIGEHNVVLNWNMAALAMVSQKRFPAENRAIELGLKNSVFMDHEAWQIERENLRRQFVEWVKPRIASGECAHFSIFALAPMPLLIEFGRLLNDISAAKVYQLHREPQDWKWQDSEVDDFDYTIVEPDEMYKVVALNLSLSATIDNARITTVLGDECSIWKITVSEPGNDFLTNSAQLTIFRVRFRDLLKRIKDKHGENTIIHIFPAVPVSVAVEIGRVWMPKADLIMRIYDHNRKLGGFNVAFDIGEVSNGD